jgi:glycosyltransferase involved in cell wall biosynthesis
MSGVPRIIVLFGNIMSWGQERANIDAMYALKQTGCEILFLVRKESWAEPLRCELSKRGLKWTAVPFMPHRIGRRMSPIQSLANLIAMIAGSLVLVRFITRWQATHIHVANPEWVFCFLPALFFTKIPVVYSIGDEPNLSHRGWRLLWRFIFARVSRFVSISRFIQNVLVANGVPSKKIKVIYGRPPFRPAPGLRWMLEKKTRFRFVYIGQIAEHKGINILLEACQTLLGKTDRFEVLIAGDLLEESCFCKHVTSFVHRNLAGHVKLLDHVEDVERLLSASDVHVCPTVREEPLGLVVMEAKRSGLPSIVFPSGGLLEMVEHGTDGYVCRDKSSRSLADAMAWYISLPDRAARQGFAARASLSKFWPTEFGQAWKEVYDETYRR